jgi:hypothetical protein
MKYHLARKDLLRGEKFGYTVLTEQRGKVKNTRRKPKAAIYDV